MPWETIHERNPQQILDRREKVSLPPFLIMQGALDDNVLPSLQEKFGAPHRAARHAAGPGLLVFPWFRARVFISA